MRFYVGALFCFPAPWNNGFKPHRNFYPGLCQLLEPALLIRCRQADQALVEQVPTLLLLIIFVVFVVKQIWPRWGWFLPCFGHILLLIVCPRSFLELLPSTRPLLAKIARWKEFSIWAFFQFPCPLQIKVDTENWLGADKTGGLEILAQKGKIKVKWSWIRILFSSW